MACCWTGAVPQCLAVRLPVSPRLPPLTPSLSRGALVRQHLPQAINPLAPERPTGSPAGHPRHQLHARGRRRPPRQSGEGAQAQHGGFWGQQGGIRRNGGEASREQHETNPSHSLSVDVKVCTATVGGVEVGCPSVPPLKNQAGCFTFFLPNKSAQKSLPGSVLLDHLTYVSLHSPLMPHTM